MNARRPMGPRPDRNHYHHDYDWYWRSWPYYDWPYDYYDDYYTDYPYYDYSLSSQQAYKQGFTHGVMHAVKNPLPKAPMPPTSPVSQTPTPKSEGEQ